MYLQVPFLLTILGLVLTNIDKTNISRERATGHRALSQLSTSLTHTDNDDVQFSPRAISMEELRKRPIIKASSNSHDFIHNVLDERKPTDKGSLTESHNNEFVTENLSMSAKGLALIMKESIYFRSARDTAAQKQPRMSDAEQPIPYNLTNLSELCPYADICDIRIMESSQGTCCLPCSCDPTCGKIGNCCDKHENIGYMCHSPVVRQLNANDTEDLAFGYLIVDKCLNGSEQDCTELGSEPWGAFYPVYDPVSEMIFYNSQCAKCSGVKEFTAWQINLLCDTTTMTNGLIRRLLQGQMDNACQIEFTPPKTMDKLKHVCADNLIDQCNVTGYWKVYDARLDAACTRWYSPTISRTGYLRFVNVFCHLCNSDDGDEHEADCQAYFPERALGLVYTLTIDYIRVSAVLDKSSDNMIKPTVNDGCVEGMVKHVSKPECRVVLCPNGFVRSEGKCQQISSKLLNSVYYVQVQLLLISDKLLPLSYLRNLTDEQRDNPESWFNTQGVPLDFCVLHYKEVEFLEELVVQVGKKKYPLSLNREIKAIKNAITKPWSITLKGDVFRFSVKLYRYADYIPNNRAQHNLELLSDQAPILGEPPMESYVVELLLRPIGHPIILKKTNFCNLVPLTRSEWIAGFREIRLNISKEVFDSETFLGDSEFDIFLDEMGEPTIEICVEDFNPHYQEQPDRRNIAAVMTGSRRAMVTSCFPFLLIIHLVSG